jgi:predicted transcriptional regulator
MSTTIRVSSDTKARIDALAASSGIQIQAVVDQAVAELERTRFFEAFNRRSAELRANPDEWREIQAERAELDGALADWIRHDEAP